MTIYKKGDVVLVRFPHSDLKTYSRRPALVIQDETIPTGLNQKIIALITSNLARTGPTRGHVRKDSPDGRLMGILTDSVIVADNIATIGPREIEKTIGRCGCMPDVENALRTILGL